MFLDNIHPTEYFNNWFKKPLLPADYSVAGIIKTLNEHPLYEDQTAQDYVMPLRRCGEKAGQFRVFGENQDNFYCFVYAGEEVQPNPPVYFESCLDLKLDYGFSDEDIIQGEHVQICSKFTDFLWHILGHHVCLRLESGDQFKAGVNGIVVTEKIKLDKHFLNPLNREFPNGYTCYISEQIICIPEWGATFLDDGTKEWFIERYDPQISNHWN